MPTMLCPTPAAQVASKLTGEPAIAPSTGTATVQPVESAKLVEVQELAEAAPSLFAQAQTASTTANVPMILMGNAFLVRDLALICAVRVLPKSPRGLAVGKVDIAH